MKKLLIISAVALAAITFTAPEASAQWGGRHGHGSHHGHGWGNHGGLSLSITRGPSFRSSSFGSYGYGAPIYRSHRPVWHDTTHLDYHGPSIVPHGRHYHVIPGHYDVHRTGHWHGGGHHH